MRVLIVSPSFSPDVGGVEGHVYEVARRLMLRGIEVAVLTTDSSRRLRPVDTVEGIPLRRVAAWPAHRDYRLAPRILSEIERSTCDLMHLHSHHTFVAPMAMVGALRRRLPFVVTFHGIGHMTRCRGPLRPVQLLLLRPLLGRAGRLIALTESERARFTQLLRLSAERFVVIPNGGDRLAAPAPERPRRGGSPVIASVGRLERFKGHHRLVGALPRVVERYPDARLIIVGAGPEEQALRALAAREGVAKHVQITALGLADRTGMAALLQGANVVALLSEAEGQPLAVLEAAALGRPLLVTEAPGLLQLVNEGIAAGVSLQASSREVAEALIRQLDHPLFPDSATIPRWDASVDALIDVYTSVAGRGDRHTASASAGRARGDSS